MKLGWEFIQKLHGTCLGISLLIVNDCFSIIGGLFGIFFGGVVVVDFFLIHLLNGLYLDP